MEKEEKIDYEKARSLAESLYIDNGMDGREIAAMLKVSEVTISRWKKEDEWEEKKKFLRVTPAKLRLKILKEAEKVAKGEKCTINADAIAKLLSAAEKLSVKATPEVVHAILKECCNYCAPIAPKETLTMSKLHRMYLQHIIEREG